VKQEFLKFTKAGGKVLPGLVKRRNDEIALYFMEPK
jgi:GH24 family phage-related lysozyme (muramidase)